MHLGILRSGKKNMPSAPIILLLFQTSIAIPLYFATYLQTKIRTYYVETNELSVI